jgi:chloramphenicol 3-O-phosphotransferase
LGTPVRGRFWKYGDMKKFMRSLATDILSALGPGRRFVAIDGVDGSGKTSFAASLVFEIQNRPVIVIHADDFLNPSPVRHAKGRASPKGSGRIPTTTRPYRISCSRRSAQRGTAGTRRLPMTQ